MKKHLTNPKKLALNTATVRTLQQDLTDDQLKQAAGGAGPTKSEFSREGVC